MGRKVEGIMEILYYHIKTRKKNLLNEPDFFSDKL